MTDTVRTEAEILALMTVTPGSKSINQQRQRDMVVSMYAAIGTVGQQTSISLASSTVVEGVAGAFVGAVNVTGLNPGEQYTYTVSDVRFEVRAGTLKLLDGQSVIFDINNPNISITLRATDSGLKFAEGVFSIAVLPNVSQGNAPTGFTLASSTVREKTPGFVIGSVFVDDLDTIDNWTYGIDDFRFEIIAQQLKLKTALSVDFSVDPTVTINVTITDSYGKTGGPFAKTLTVLQRRPPQNIVLSDDQILSASAGYGIGIATVTPGEVGDAQVLTVDDSRFEVIQSTGQVRLLAGQSITLDTFVSGNVWFDRSQATAEYLHRGTALSSWNDGKQFCGAIADVEFMGDDGTLQTIFSDTANNFVMNRRADNKLEIQAHESSVVTVTPGTSLVTSTNATVYTTPAFTPAAGELLIVSLVSSDVAATPVVVTTTGITFYRAFNVGQAALYIANSFATNESMAVIADSGSDAASGIAISVDRIAGMSRAGVGAIRPGQAAAASGTINVTPQCVFPRAVLSDSLIWGMVRNASNTAEAAPTGFTEIIDSGFTGPDRRLEVVYRNTGHSGTTVTWGGNSIASAWNAFAVEFDVSSAISVVRLISTNSYTADGKQYNILFGANAGNASMFLFAAPKGTPLVDVLDGSSAIRDATIDLQNGADFFIGINSILGDRLNAKLGKFTLKDACPTLTQQAARDKFFTAAGMVANWATTEPYGAGVVPTFHLHIANGETVTQYAAGETGSNAFTINGTPTPFAPTPNENTILLRITATNQFGLTFGKTFTLRVVATTVGTAPSAITPASATIQSAAQGAVVADIEVTDDVGDTHTFVINDSRFEVVASTGGPPVYTLKVKAGLSILYAVEQIVNLTLTVTDQNQRSAQFAFTINIAPPSGGRIVTVTDVTALLAATAGAQPGDNIHVRAGTYDLPAGLNVSTLIGTAASPIKLVSVDGRGQALLRGPTTNTPVITGFRFGEFFGIYNFLIECRSLTGDSGGVKISGKFGLEKPHDFVIAGNIIRSNNNGTLSGQDCIKIFEDTYRWMAVANRFEGTWRESGFDILSCKDFILAYNETAVGTVFGTSSQGETGMFYTKCGCRDGLILRNNAGDYFPGEGQTGGFGVTSGISNPVPDDVLAAWHCRNVTTRHNRAKLWRMPGAQNCLCEGNVLGPRSGSPLQGQTANGFPSDFVTYKDNFTYNTSGGPGIDAPAPNNIFINNIETTTLPALAVGVAACPVNVLDILPGQYDLGIPDLP